MPNYGGGDIRQQVTVEMQGIGADTVTILAQALQELQAKFATTVSGFDKGEKTALELLAVLKQLATGLADVGSIASAEADRMAAFEAAQKKATAATEAFIEKTNAALARQDAAEARLDAQSRARMDAKAAKDKKTLDDIAAASEKAAKASARAADEMAKSIAQGAEKSAMAALEASRAFERTVLPLDALVMSAKQLQSQRIDAAFNAAAAAADREADELEQLNKGFIQQAQDVGMATRATKEQIQALKDMGVIQDAVNTKTAGGAKNLGGFASKADAAADKSKRMGQNMMSVAYALDDVRYGIGAVINNVPMLAQAFGATPLWAANIAIASIAVYELGKAMAPVATQFARDWGIIEDTTKRFTGSIDDAKARLEALQAKPYKVQVDYDEIAQAERVLEKMQERLNAFNAGKRDNLQEEMAKAAKAATHDYAGGTLGLEKIVAEGEAVKGISHAAGSDIADASKLREEIKKMEAADKTGWNGADLLDALEFRKQELVDLEHKIKEQEQNWVKGEVGAFELGDQGAIQRMQNRARQTPGAFARVGPGGVTAAEAIANVPSTPEAMLRSIDADAQDKENQEKLAEFSRQNQEANRKAAKAGREGAKSRKKTQKEYDDQTERMEAAERDAADLVRSIDHEALVNQQKAARGAPKAADKAREARYSRGVRNLNPGMTAEQAATVAHRMDDLVQHGASPQQAYSTAFEEFMKHFQEMSRNVLEMRAMQEQQAGFMGQASQLLMELNAKTRAGGMNQARLARGTRSTMSFFGTN